METFSIAANMFSGLRGLVIAQPLPVGEPVVVNGTTFTVKRCTKIEISYHGARKVLSIRADWKYYCHHGNRLKFLNQCGYSTEREFMADHMKSPVYVFGFAQSYRYFVDFYEPFV